MRPDYKKQALEELARIESRVLLLNEMIMAKKPSDRFDKDRTMEELYGHAKSAQTRIQKILEEDHDEERIGRLLEMNDMINHVLECYNNFMAGKPIEPKTSG
jgi:ADP-ribosylation factor-binding protein GGA